MVLHFGGNSNVVLDSNCIIDSPVHSIAPIALVDTGMTVTSMNNYVSPADPSLACNFVSLFDIDRNGAVPSRCIEFEADFCSLFPAPSASPSLAPSMTIFQQPSEVASSGSSAMPIIATPVPTPTSSSTRAMSTVMSALLVVLTTMTVIVLVNGNTLTNV